MSQIRAMADRISSVGGADDVWETALSFLPGFGLSKVVFLDLSERRTPVVRSNAGRRWNNDYRASVSSGRDPFAVNCLSRIDPVLTGVAHFESHQYLGKPALDMIAKGSETLDITTGMSITIRPDAQAAGIGWNLMSQHSVREFAELRAYHEPEWRAWCQLTFAGLSLSDAQHPFDTLTARERDCLAYVADGLRTADIAYRLGIAEVTVEMHLRKARHRLRARTRDHAVAVAIRQGLI
ncbi:helix-turn-helix transcriptional regulator [Sulfitobacter geojensis]|uniref:helix-turn-helix transcriptional regulator n=1 Tax=Sulfitobacter geojensis TaxID=1342299 RepID=UPI002490F69C|nr:helix-turn-helix transcriptional regulator [Sulfitobacter geojensis]